MMDFFNRERISYDRFTKKNMYFSQKNKKIVVFLNKKQKKYEKMNHMKNKKKNKFWTKKKIMKGVSLSARAIGRLIIRIGSCSSPSDFRHDSRNKKFSNCG